MKRFYIRVLVPEFGFQHAGHYAEAWRAVEGAKTYVGHYETRVGHYEKGTFVTDWRPECQQLRKSA